MLKGKSQRQMAVLFHITVPAEDQSFLVNESDESCDQGFKKDLL